MNLTLLQLRSFLAAADALNFTSAAERLNIRQPTLSSNIKSLELAIGGRLFDRDTHSVRLTDLGKACQRHAIRLLEDVERTQADLRKHVTGAAGTLRIAALPHIFPALLARPLALFRALRPGVALEFHDVATHEAVALLRQGHVDVAIVNESGNEPDIRYQFLTERRFVALMPANHALAAQTAITWQSLSGYDLIVVRSKELEDSRLAEALRLADALPTLTHKVNQLSTAVGLVEAGVGVALMAHYTAQHVVRPHLQIRPLVGPELTGRVSMLTLAQREVLPAARLLQETLVGALAQAGGRRTDPAASTT